MASTDGCKIKYKKMVEFRRTTRKNTHRSFKQRNDSSTLDFLSVFKFKSEIGFWPCSVTRTAIGSITPVYSDSVWINCFGSKEMKLVTRDGKDRRSVTFPEAITHTQVAPSGEILFASDMGHSVKKLNLKGQTEVVLDIRPFVTRGICCMKDGSILVCAIDISGGKLYKSSVMDSSGPEIIEYDEKGKPLFQHPYRVIENSNGDIFVADIDAFCLVCLQNSGKFRFKYSGSQRKEAMCKFCPYGLTNNKQGEIIVLDYWNHCVHLLDPDGNFIQFIMTQHDKLHYPLTAVMDKDDCLWVGCKDGNVIVVKFRIDV